MMILMVTLRKIMKMKRVMTKYLNLLLFLLQAPQMNPVPNTPNFSHFANSPSFTGSCGAVLDVRDKSLLEIFSLLVPDELLEVIVEQTNLFAQQFLDKENVPPSSRVH